MKRYSFAVLAALSGPALSHAQETAPIADIAHVAGLQKPVTAKFATTPLPTILKALSKDSGVPIEATMSMSPLKATVLVKDQPVGVVMARLADVFHGEWRQSGDLYRLSIPSDWSTRESAFIRAEDDAQRKEVYTTLRALMAGTNVPYDRVMQDLNDPKTSAARKEELGRVRTPSAYLLGYTFAHLSNAQWQTFWAGKPVRASVFVRTPNQQVVPPPNASADQTASTQVQRRLPQFPGRGLPPGQQGQQGQQEAGAASQGINVRAFASYNPLTGELKSSENGIGARANVAPSLVAHPFPEGELASLPFGKEVLLWSRVEEESPILKTPVSGPLPAGTYFNGQHSLGDILTWVHEKTNVSIVADAFRVSVRTLNASGTVASVLEGLANSNHEFLRTENGFVMMRHGGFWRLKTLELPEDAYQRIETAKPPKLDDYATFAANLKPAQCLAFRVPNAVLTRFDPEPLRSGMPALRFYATLSGSERQAALAGRALPFVRLSSSAQELFAEALNDPDGKPVGASGLNPDDPQVSAAMGFLMGSSTAERVVADTSGVTRRGVGGARKMLFGTSPQDGVQYLIPVD